MKLVKKLSLFILLILTLSLKLSSQTSSKDTIRCFGVTQLRGIAIKLAKCTECDTLLKIADKQIFIKDSTINLKTIQISNLEKQVNLCNTVIEGKSHDITRLTNDLNSAITKKEYWKYGCIGTGTLAFVFGLVLMAR